jgi:uncharacterized protein YjbI with pentapeptide repeats
MTRDETVALFLQGREAWNAWAEKMLGERKAIEADGRWPAAEKLTGELEPENEESRAWMQTAQANFSHCHFLVRGTEGKKMAAEDEEKEGDTTEPPVRLIQLEAEYVDFTGFIFPGNAWFEQVTFSFDVWFRSCIFSETAWFEHTPFCGDAGFGSVTFSGDPWFEHTTFSGDAYFGSATFSGSARFEHATFSGGAWFGNATFSGDTRFGSANFSGDARFGSANFSGGAQFEQVSFIGDAWFGSATLSGVARFKQATFSRDAWFGSATFSGDVRFEHATFSGVAWFGSTTFQNSADYREAKFEKQASFAGIRADQAFDMTGAKFQQVPAFNQADFKQAPDLDNVEFPLPLFWTKGQSELIAKYRAIRRMAIQGADYDREQMAFKGELRSRRWTTDRARHLGTWFGLFYDGIADCGRSIVRPLLIWITSVPVFAVLYLRAADQAQGWGCGVPLIRGMFLSGRNALVLFSAGRDARIAQAYQCLYGGSIAEPQIPDSVSFVESFVQVPFSAVLIFLLLLAIKNQFKIK